VTTDKASLEDIHVIRTWPGKDGEWKTPTRIAYASENASLKLKENLWGYQVEPNMVSYSWTKLLLDSTTTTTTFDDPNLLSAIDEGRLRLPTFRDAQGVAADFMTCLYRHMQTKLLKELGPSVLDATPMDCWLTVPAVWSDQAQNITKAAATQAGFGCRPGDTINVISEPEAAAISVLKNIMRSESLMKPAIGENLLICDCGGGTVDITSYSIEQIEPTPVFEEICVGIGGKCGATSIDRGLQNLMSTRFGHAWDCIEKKRKGPGSQFMDRWEIVKRQFGGSGDDRTHKLGPLKLEGIPDSRWYDGEEAMILLTKADVNSVFDPTIDEVTNLVQKQKSMIEANGKTLNRLVLVGGFGESDYLFAKLSAWCGTETRVTCPEYPQAAIVRGAALRGLLDIAPRKKRCRRHYGFIVSKPFIEGVDPPEEAFIDQCDGKKMCKNKMKWIAHRGDEISKDTFRSHRLTQTRYAKDWDMTCSIIFYGCDLDAAPSRYIASQLTTIGRIAIDFSGIDISRFPTRRQHEYFGSRYYKLPYELQVMFGSKSGSLQVRTLCEGILTGSAEIMYD